MLSAVLLLTATLGADLGGSPADVARAAMHVALQQAAPVPSHIPALPEGPLPRGQMTDATRAMRRDAERMAVEHAKKDASADAHHRAGNAAGAHGEATDMMRGRDGADPAEMMRSRGMAPGGGPMMPSPGPQHNGM